MSKTGAAYLAASFLTSQRNAGVAATYIDWIEDQVNPTTAEDALLAAARSSKSPAAVLARAATFYAAFEADPATITTITPATGAAAGGTAIALVGTNFTGATALTLGGVACTSLVVVNDTHITAVTGAHAAGAVSAVITTPVSAVTKTNAYTYV